MPYSPTAPGKYGTARDVVCDAAGSDRRAPVPCIVQIRTVSVAGRTRHLHR